MLFFLISVKLNDYLNNLLHITIHQVIQFTVYKFCWEFKILSSHWFLMSFLVIILQYFKRYFHVLQIFTLKLISHTHLRTVILLYYSFYYDIYPYQYNSDVDFVSDVKDNHWNFVWVGSLLRVKAFDKPWAVIEILFCKMGEVGKEMVIVI